MLSNTQNSDDGSVISNTNPSEKDKAKSNDGGEPAMKFEIPEESTNGLLLTHSLWNFCKFTNGPQQPNLEGLPIEAQETAIVTELLYILVGMRGTFIEPNDGESAEGDYNITFKISQSIHPSLRDMIQNILPMASHYICVQKYLQMAQNDDAGAVSQALSSSLEDMTHDYYKYIAEMETHLIESGLSLQKLQFLLRPLLRNIGPIDKLLVEIMTKNLRGSDILTLLYNAMDSLLTDDHLHSMIGVLLKHAAVPYMNALELWLEKGVIIDPSQEFLIEDIEQCKYHHLPDSKSLQYWDQRYKIRSKHIPHFLKDLALKILKTGKYLNVVFKCCKEIKPKKIKLEFEPSKQDIFLQLINNAYTYSSKILYKIISKDNDLMGHLWSVKHFLLLNQGDFIMNFLDTCDEELSKIHKDISTIKVYNLIQMMLRVSSLHDDPYKDYLNCKFLPTDLNTQVRIVMGQYDLSELKSRDEENGILSGYQSIAFDYVAPWPMSLIMNDFIIGEYQLIFRLLFYCKYVENELGKTWKSRLKINREAFILRHQLIITTQNFGYFITADVIEPNWQIFIAQVKKAEDFDTFNELHCKFLDEVLKNIFISHLIHLTNDMINILNVCLEFCKVMKDVSEPETKVNSLSLKFRNALSKFLSDIRQINTPNLISTLSDRINFNQFYSEKSQLEETNEVKDENET